jgi:Ni/Fe-hydrogenase 1 B-type cytochrome subunit
VYSAWLMDVKEKNGVISSIFGGYKSVPEGKE